MVYFQLTHATTRTTYYSISKWIVECSMVEHAHNPSTQGSNQGGSWFPSQLGSLVRFCLTGEKNKRPASSPGVPPTCCCFFIPVNVVENICSLYLYLKEFSESSHFHPRKASVFMLACTTNGEPGYGWNI